MELFIMFKTLSVSLVALSLVAVAQPASADNKKILPPQQIKLPVIKSPVKVLTPAEKAALEAAAVKAAAEAAVKPAAGN